MRRLVVASAILATLLTTPLGLAAAITSSGAPTDSQRATAALEYLLAAQRSDGSIDGQLGETADLVIGAAAAGYDPAILRGCGGGTGALSFLATASDGAAADAAATGKAILAVVAAGGDPSDFAGRNLASRLGSLYHSGTGAYGNGSTFSQSFAVLASVAFGGSAPAAATSVLANLQGSDGSWSYGSARPKPGDGDTNSTAVALMALDAAGDHSADKTGLAYLLTQQLSDGGFPYQNSSVYGPPASDPDSDAVVLQALLAAGQDPAAAGWSKGSHDVLTQLRSSQGADGGFAYPGSAENAFTTREVPAALMRVPYAGPLHFTAGRSVPTVGCARPTPSPSRSAAARATPTARRTPKPTRRPTARPATKPTPGPTVTPTAMPTDRPTDGMVLPTESTASISPAATPSAGPTMAGTPASSPSVRVAGVTSMPAGRALDRSGSSVPPALLYGVAALIALIAVLGGGWIFVTRPGRR
jgi:hypothetical protein